MAKGVFCPQVYMVFLITLLAGCGVTPLINGSADLWEDPESHWKKMKNGVSISFNPVPQIPNASEETQLAVLSRPPPAGHGRHGRS